MDMKVNTKHIKTIILVVLFTLLSKVAFSAEIESPETVLNDFYHAYLNDEGRNESEVVGKYVLTDVIQSVNNASLCNYDSDDSVSTTNGKGDCSNKRECKTSDGEYVCNWNGVWVEMDTDYFTKSQDIYPTWSKSIAVAPLKGGKEDIDYLVFLGKAPDPVMKLKVSLVSGEHGWKISKVTKY
ncbi:DUF3828 domain-containing protein [Klebsiella aerogenes]